MTNRDYEGAEHADWAEHAAAYALNALEPDEQPAFETHLARCPTCQDEVRQLQDAAGLLAASGAAEVPELFRARVLAAAATEPQELAEPISVTPARPEASPVRRWLRPALAVAAVLAAVVVTVAVVGSGSPGPSADDIITAGDAVTVSIEAEPDLAGISGDFTYSRAENASLLVLRAVPAVPTGSVYQLWFVGADGATPSQTFTPDADGFVELIVERANGSADLIGVTVEPSGGSAQPTTPILLTASLDT